MTTRKSLSGESRDSLLSKRSNRRDLLKRGLAFGLGVPALAGALAAADEAVENHGLPGGGGSLTDLSWHSAMAAGAVGDGVADDTDAINAAIAAAKADGQGVIYLPPGKTFKTRGFAIDQSQLTVIARGATIIHSGANEPLVTIGDPSGGGARQRIRWIGGTLKAKPSTVNPTTALMYIQTAWRTVIDGVTLQGGNDNDSERYATNGLWIKGEPDKSSYWSTVISPYIHGCIDAGILIDGWNETKQLDYAGLFSYLGVTIFHNGRGVVARSGGDQYYGGDIEANDGYGITLEEHALDVGFWGVHLETNNGATTNPQLWIAVTPSNLGRNTFVGAVSTPPPTDQLRQFKFYAGTRNWTFGRPLDMLDAVNVSRVQAEDPVVQYGIDGENWPRGRMLAAGKLQLRDPANDVNSYFTALQSDGMNDVGPDATVTFRSPAGIRIGASGSLLKGLFSVTASPVFGSIPAGGAVERTVTVSGAAVGDSVTASPNGSPGAALVWSAYVSGPDTVTVRLANITAKPIDATERTWRIGVTKY